jgi:uncharacterized protein
VKRQFSPRRLDVHAFAEDAAQLSGQAPMSDFPRLVEEARGDVLGTVDWSAEGKLLNPRHVRPQVWLHLRADTTLPMVCQRCLERVDVQLGVDRDFRFVPDEETAALEDDESEEDLLAISRSFDLLSLVEDELLMEVPLVPRHDVCPVAIPMSAQDADFREEERPNPFAPLQVLKGGKQ